MYLLIFVVTKPHLLAAHQDHFPLAQALFLSVCSSSRLPDSHRSPSQMPWRILHVCEHIRVNMCVCAPPASPQQDCQSVCDYTPTHLRLFCFLTIPLSLASFFRPPLISQSNQSSTRSIQANEGLIATFSISPSLALLHDAA